MFLVIDLAALLSTRAGLFSALSGIAMVSIFVAIVAFIISEETKSRRLAFFAGAVMMFAALATVTVVGIVAGAFLGT